MLCPYFHVKLFDFNALGSVILWLKCTLAYSTLSYTLHSQTPPKILMKDFYSRDWSLLGT